MLEMGLAELVAGDLGSGFVGECQASSFRGGLPEPIVLELGGAFQEHQGSVGGFRSWLGRRDNGRLIGGWRRRLGLLDVGLGRRCGRVRRLRWRVVTATGHEQHCRCQHSGEKPPAGGAL